MAVTYFKHCKIHYQVSGKGKAVVLLHGFLENLNMWEEVTSVLSKRNRVIRIDLLGHGQSGNLGYIHTMEDQAEMVKHVLSELNLRKYVMIGHSMGGYIALAFAEKYPSNIKGLCLMNSTALDDTAEKRINRDRGIAAVKQNAKTFVRLAIPMLFSEYNRNHMKAIIDEVTDQAVLTPPQGIIAALEGMKIRKSRVHLLHENRFPTQMIIGKNDPALDVSSLIEQTSEDKTSVVIFEGGHMSHLEHTQELIQALAAFVKMC